MIKANNRGKIAEDSVAERILSGEQRSYRRELEEFEQLKAAFHDNTSELGRVDQEGFENAIEELSKDIFATSHLRVSTRSWMLWDTRRLCCCLRVCRTYTSHGWMR